MKVTMIPFVTGALGTIPKGFVKGHEESENGDYLNYRVVKIGQNTKKSPRDLRRLAVTQTPVKDHQLKADFVGFLCYLASLLLFKETKQSQLLADGLSPESE